MYQAIDVRHRFCQHSEPQEIGYCSKLSAVICVASLIALIVIGGLTIAGKFPLPTASWLAVGLSSCSGLFFSLTYGKKKPKLILPTLLIMSAFIAIGVAGGMGGLGRIPTGCGIVGIPACVAGTTFCVWMYYRVKREKDKRLLLSTTD